MPAARTTDTSRARAFSRRSTPPAQPTHRPSSSAHGEVVGVYRDASQTRHGFTWSRGAFTTFDVPGSAGPLGTGGFGINDHGQVVGTYVDGAGNRHGFLRSKGIYTTLDVPDALLTVAEGINNHGEIVGLSIDADGNQHGFVWCEGVYATIDVPGESNTAVLSISARGDRGILCRCQRRYPRLRRKAYPLTPVVSSRALGSCGRERHDLRRVPPWTRQTP